MDIHHILFTHSLVDKQLSCVHFLAIMNDAAVNICLWGFLFRSVSSFPLGVELLDHMVALCLTFWGGAPRFSKVTAPFYITTSSVWGFQFLYIFANICYYFLPVAILVSVKWYLSVVLICISLMTDDVEQLFRFLLAIYISSWKNGYSDSLPILKLSCLFTIYLWEFFI